ncbi:MAG: hypothetical protein IKZ28_03480, partial [Clostridia bacterium]|nr:hypothetical protein [Clostridia bacterium]
MKKIKILTILLFSTLLLACGCAIKGFPEGNDGGDKNSEIPTKSGFEVVASRQVFYHTDTEPIALSVRSNEGLSYNEVVYKIIDGEGCASVDEGGMVEFNGGGSSFVTVKAIVDGKESDNELVLYQIRWSLLDDKGLENIPLTTMDIGDETPIVRYTPEQSLYHAFKIETGECAKVNENGALEVTGVTDGEEIFLKDIDGKLLWSGTLQTKNGVFNRAARSALIEKGVVAEGENIPLETISMVTELDLNGVKFETAEPFAKLAFFPRLEKLNLSGGTVFDLAYLSGNGSLKELAVENLQEFDLSHRETVFTVLDSLPRLDKLSIKGSFGVFDRDFCNGLLSRAKKGDFVLTVLDGVEMTENGADGFMDSVFFSAKELTEHLSVNDGFLTPTGEYTHAIINLAFDNSEEADKYIPIKAGGVTLLETYGGGRNFRTSLTATGDLTLNMYAYGFYMGYNNAIHAIESSGNLRINAMYGTCWLKGGDSVNVTDGTGTWFQSNGSGVFCQDLTLYAEPNAILQINGGSGNQGSDGVADGSNPNSATSQKHGSKGYAGECAVNARQVQIFGGTFYIYGGAGGRGGRGG